MNALDDGKVGHGGAGSAGLRNSGPGAARKMVAANAISIRREADDALRECQLSGHAMVRRARAMRVFRGPEKHVALESQDPRP